MRKIKRTTFFFYCIFTEYSCYTFEHKPIFKMITGDINILYTEFSYYRL